MSKRPGLMKKLAEVFIEVSRNTGVLMTNLQLTQEARKRGISVSNPKTVQKIGTWCRRGFANVLASGGCGTQRLQDMCRELKKAAQDGADRTQLFAIAYYYLQGLPEDLIRPTMVKSVKMVARPSARSPGISTASEVVRCFRLYPEHATDLRSGKRTYGAMRALLYNPLPENNLPHADAIPDVTKAHVSNLTKQDAQTTIFKETEQVTGGSSLTERDPVDLANDVLNKFIALLIAALKSAESALSPDAGDELGFDEEDA